MGMAEPFPTCGRTVAAVLGVALAALAAPAPARADHLAAALAAVPAGAGAVTFRPGDERPPDPSAENAADGLLPAGLVLVVPAGTTSVSPGSTGSNSGGGTSNSGGASTSASSFGQTGSVVKAPVGSQGGGTDNGGGTAQVASTGAPTDFAPEPAALLTAAIGTGVAGFLALRRRRR
jgi:hypothetical protein